MAVYTVKVAGVCSGGEHISLDIKRDGTTVKRLTVTKTEILHADTDIEDALIYFLRQAIRKAGATTLSKAKTAVEAAQWVI